MTESDKIEILLSTIDRHWGQAKQSEDQRSKMTNYLLVLYLAAQGFIVQKDFDRSTIMVSVIIIIVAIYGVLASFKYYERFRLHATRVGRLMDVFDKFSDGISLNIIEKTADNDHKLNFPRLHKIRLNKIWILLHCAFAVVGVVDICISFS
ncbi:hypothetical protein [Mucilaginibacter gotjawali]|uniref:SMODS and SLOG-associating 2TM effector domain-containing protein n=1 Tax=Mucilaginibacter gotjawali TaxID=1550579 RepID=A0A839SB28_9SPHI|nr:hypothetical protein [Mucilaginibacter gotjawali]MBB3054788.1 hypothetical protein [Mucilaginibacter gotjawali]